MKTYIDKVSNPEFYSKHAGKRLPAVAMRLIFQAFSLLTATIGAHSVFPIENDYFRIAAALMFAFALEAAIMFFGYSAILPWAEKVGGTKAYVIEPGATTIDKYVNAASKCLFYGPLLASAILTFIGAFSVGQSVKDPGPKPVFETYIEQARNEVTQKQVYAGDPRIKELSAISKTVDQKAAYIASQDSINAKNRDDFNKSQAAGKPVWGLYHSSKEWFEVASKTEKADLKQMQQRLSILSDALAGLNDKMESEVQTIAERRYSEDLAGWEKLSEGAGWNGKLFLLFGLVAQSGVFLLFFFVVMVDIGTGQIKRRESTAFDRVNLLSQRWGIIADRFKQTFYVSNVNLSERPLKIEYKPGQEMAGYMLRNKVGELRLYKPAPFDVYDKSTPTPTGATIDNLEEFEAILNSVYNGTNGTLNGHNPTGITKDLHGRDSGKLEKNVNNLLESLEIIDLSKIDDIENFELFRYDPTGFFHVNRRSGKGKWKDYTAVSNAASEYAGRVKRSTENLQELGSTGNGMMQDKVREALQNQKQVFTYWYSAKVILQMIKEGVLSRADVDAINAKIRESLFEKTTI